MKYVYAVLTVIENKPIMQTLVSDNQLSGRKILEDLNKKQSIRVEIQEVEV